MQQQKNRALILRIEGGCFMRSRVELYARGNYKGEIIGIYAMGTRQNKMNYPNSVFRRNEMTRILARTVVEQLRRDIHERFHSLI
jgi:hypothetical protein